jgi:hypothetical protein
MFPQNTTEQLLLNLEFSGPDNQHVIVYLLATIRQKNDESILKNVWFEA